MARRKLTAEEKALRARPWFVDCSSCEVSYPQDDIMDEVYPVYECNSCGEVFGKDETDNFNHVCPECNKWAAKTEFVKCPDCEDMEAFWTQEPEYKTSTEIEEEETLQSDDAWEEIEWSDLKVTQKVKWDGQVLEVEYVGEGEDATGDHLVILLSDGEEHIVYPASETKGVEVLKT